MPDPLLGPRIKLQRAQHHLVELERTERQFFEANPCRIVFDTESQPGHKLAKIVLDARPPEIMHVIAGELIYQLRSALDQTAVAFARLSSGPTKPKQVHYPTGESWRDFKAKCCGVDKSGKLVGHLRHFDGDLRKAIMRTRPYNGGNETLRAVFRMANIDKHMELIAIGASGGIRGMKDFNISGAHIGLLIGPDGNLNEGVVFSDLLPEGTITPKNAQAQIHVAGQVTLGDVSPYTREPLVPFLRSMVEEVGRVHARLEALLVETGRKIAQDSSGIAEKGLSFSFPFGLLSGGNHFRVTG